MKIIFTGGGTAGHLFPILAIARELRKNYSEPDLDLYYFGPKNQKTDILFSIENIKIKNIPSGKIRRYPSFDNFIDLFKLPCGVIKAFCLLFFKAPDLIFSKGGYGSFPTVLAGRMLRVPIFLHESDSIAGLASKIESKWCVEVFSSFEKTEKLPEEKIVCLGNPIRSEVIGETGQDNKKAAKSFLGIETQKPILLILGGSQGAMSINNLLLETLPDILPEFEVIHQTGDISFQQIKKEVKVLVNSPALLASYHSFAFLNEAQLKNAYTASDLIISRAGGGAIFEIAASKKPAILIPLPGAAQNHQAKNSYFFQARGACEVLEEDNLKAHLFLEKIKYLFYNPELLRTMAENSANFARPKAARLIANYLLEYLYRSFAPIEGQ